MNSIKQTYNIINAEGIYVVDGIVYAILKRKPFLKQDGQLSLYKNESKEGALTLVE